MYRLTIVTPHGERPKVALVRVIDVEEAIPEWVVRPRARVEVNLTVKDYLDGDERL